MRRRLAFSYVLLLMLVLGFYPKPVTDVINPAVQATMQDVGAHDPAPTQAAPAESKLLLRVRELALQRLALLDERLQALDQILGPGFQDAGGLFEACVRIREVGACAISRQRLDAADAGRACAFGDDLDEADVASAAGVRAAAEFDRPSFVSTRRGVAHGHHAHLVAILLSEERHGA